MRVIAGSAKGRRLAGPRSHGTRPTSDLVRGALFSALESMGADFTRVLDLYAGTGALGIEALSRGGQWCDFVEREPRACDSIRANLRQTGLDAHAKVHCAAVANVAGRLEGPYSLVLADPPYATGALADLERAVGPEIIEAGRTVLALEHSSREDPPDQLGGLSSVKTLKHGDSAVSIFR